MTGPGDGARLLLTVLLAAWVMAYAYSVFEISATGDITKLLDLDLQHQPSLYFLGWQGIAGIIAVGIYGVSRLWPRGAAARQIGNVPLLLAIVLVAALSAVLVFGQQAP